MTSHREENLSNVLPIMEVVVSSRRLFQRHDTIDDGVKLSTHHTFHQTLHLSKQNVLSGPCPHVDAHQ